MGTGSGKAIIGTPGGASAEDRSSVAAKRTDVHVLLLGKLDTGPLGSPPPSGKALADALDSAPTISERARLAAGGTLAIEQARAVPWQNGSSR
jgi:hypothetical protein